MLLPVADICVRGERDHRGEEKSRERERLLCTICSGAGAADYARARLVYRFRLYKSGVVRIRRTGIFLGGTSTSRVDSFGFFLFSEGIYTFAIRFLFLVSY